MHSLSSTLQRSHTTVTQAGSSTHWRPNPATSRAILTLSRPLSRGRVRHQVANRRVARGDMGLMWRTAPWPERWPHRVRRRNDLLASFWIGIRIGPRLRNSAESRPHGLAISSSTSQYFDRTSISISSVCRGKIVPSPQLHMQNGSREQNHAL